MKKDGKKKTHKFDTWPPPRKSEKEEADEKKKLSERSPKNASYRDPYYEELEQTDVAVYDNEQGAEQEEQQKEEDKEEEKDEEKDR